MKVNIPMTPQCVKVLVEYLIDHDDDINIGINDFGGLKIVFEELVGDMGCSLGYEQQESLIKKTAERLCKDLESDFEKYILNNIDLFPAEEVNYAKLKKFNPALDTLRAEGKYQRNMTQLALKKPLT